MASRSSARERRSSAKTDQVLVVRPSSWTPYESSFVDLRLLVVGADGDPVRAGRVREDDAAAGATGLRLREGEAPRVVGVGVGRGVVREGPRRLERRPRPEDDGDRNGDERRVGGRRAERRGASAPEKGMPVRDDSRLTVTPVFASGESWTSSAAERSVPSKNSFGRSPAIVPRRKPARHADRAAREARRSRPPRGPRRSRGRSGPAPRTRRHRPGA